MAEIKRYNVTADWAHSGLIEAGDFVYVGYCAGNVEGDITEQVNGALNTLEWQLDSLGLTLENVVQVDALFRDIWDIPKMEEVFKARFKGKYPVRKSIQTAFAHESLLFQLDAVAYKG